jgi:hypothetical protein
MSVNFKGPFVRLRALVSATAKTNGSLLRWYD